MSVWLSIVSGMARSEAADTEDSVSDYVDNPEENKVKILKSQKENKI